MASLVRRIKFPINALKARLRLQRRMDVPKALERKAHEKVVSAKREVNGKRIAITYTSTWKEFVDKNKTIIRDFLQARRQILKGAKRAKAGIATVEELKKKGTINFKTYKVSAKGIMFFVKEQRQGKQGRNFEPEFDLAQEQIEKLMKAENIVRNPRFEIARYHLAWTKGENSYLVTDFYNAQPLLKAPNLVKMLARGIEARLLANGIGDVEFLWVPSKQKAVIIDLR